MQWLLKNTKYFLTSEESSSQEKPNTCAGCTAQCDEISIPEKQSIA